MAGIQTNRTAEGLLTLPAAVAGEIWAGTLENSVVQRLARQIAMPASGTQVQMITGEPEAGWVNETDEKPTSNAEFGTKFIRPYKLAVIELFSDEFRRDYATLYAELARRLPYALGRKFDLAALGYEASPGEGFDTLADAPEIALDGTVAPFFNALGSVADAGGNVTGWAVTPRLEIDAMQINDGNNRPIFMNSLSTDGSIGSILGRPVQKMNGIANGDVEGIAGDWSQAAWGAVEGIQIAMTDQATINHNGTQVNLWQRNMFALRAEIEIGFGVRDVNRFAKLVSSAEPAA